ncbi:FRG domain-containing protein [Algoriphagus resistens]|uniref:FRG domain-containing protein n=1 Tax=Algoriphagus resistens TaxID=1750590 RepID=UPI00071696E1|nr:FRG domain-containing protein [Algoriphagus resistens]
MAELQEYKTLDEKRALFRNGNDESFIINTIEELDIWFENVKEFEIDNASLDATALIYRGTKEAKYKLYTSAQRLWILENLNQWGNKDFLDFVKTMIINANKNVLINKVFSLYFTNVKTHRDFPILSLLQHYGAPTPLMDWSYNQNVAFYFATEKLDLFTYEKDKIENYFSIYRINKRNYVKELLNIIDFDYGKYPSIEDFQKTIHGQNLKNSNFIFYISDFEEKGESTGKIKPSKNLMIRTDKPYTHTYNQNIIPQEGLFIFNPYPEKNLEDIFNPKIFEDGVNLHLSPFDCFNIHKDLAKYLKRKINVIHQINKPFIYPNLNEYTQIIKENALDSLLKK